MTAYRIFAAGIAAAVFGCISPAFADDHQAGDVARGKYLVTLMACSDCHTPGHFLGRPDMTKFLGGSDVGFHLPGLGYVWGANLTPDKEHGLGNWSDADIIKAMRTGVRPDGRQLAPAMPWMEYGGMTDEDAHAIVAFLRTLPANPVADHPPQGDGETPVAAYQEVVFPPGVAPPGPAAQP